MEPFIEKQIVDAGEIVETKQGKKTKYVLVLGAIILFLFGTALGILLASKNNPPVQTTRPLAPTLPPAQPTIKISSPFATSSALLAIENELKISKTEIENTELFEPSLSIPSFDLEINLKE